ncbi:hypothetical protein SDRG_11737 [Saprolegnia diclina VS20]|uniref:Uncharacterized protein n=1 Tax=Saprolegnia diclina (strain VS20) TaxID=1156394 RepID=T0PYQ7_SAPDV|nr:hypothetical protein SDRG_11737 [Saprolegnia diclina VS20]EQC30684.1 hypothetical protein SDRG_11737 [Saprolegnia diclina VS20]|eukprot:XP_008616010.1 hypothetical protein SDRG_11737 [Saprolegnia diclina VS20]
MLQRLPLPSSRLLPFSSRLFVYSSIGSIVYCTHGQFENVSNAFYAGAWSLPLTINGVDRPAGAYNTASVACIGSLLLPWLVYPLMSCLGFSILSAMSCRYLYDRQWTLDIAWTQRNALLSATRLPRLLTSLPLGEESAISIGNKVFCKPSAQAVLGFATIVERTTSRVEVALNVCPTPSGKEGDKCFAKLKLLKTAPLTLVVSTYALVPILLGCRRPASPKGTITGNEFTAVTTPASTTSLRKLIGSKHFVYNRGVCLA